MLDKLEVLHADALMQLQQAQSMRELDAVRVQFLGKKGALTQLLKELGQVPLEQRRQQGQVLNEKKSALELAIKARAQSLEREALSQHISNTYLDVSLPARQASLGHLHPLSHTMAWVEDWFQRFGFEVVQGPEIEDDYHNFEALNIPSHHPARAMHDTFYLQSGEVLRTHTSPVQIRAMTKSEPPFRIIAPGRVYRCDSDATHTPQFHQLEGLLVDTSIHMGHLKGVLNQFLRAFFDEEIKIRWRPSYFPFTEPSVEIDIKRGDSPWLEILGAGMVHPKVLQNCNIDPKRFTGFAFGMGLERLTMLRYGISDLRWFFENDLRFLSQF